MKSPPPEDAALAVSLGRWLRSLRTARALSQEHVAHEAGIDVTTYGRIERAVRGARWANPRLQTTRKLLKALGVGAEEMSAFLDSSSLTKFVVTECGSCGVVDSGGEGATRVTLSGRPLSIAPVSPSRETSSARASESNSGRFSSLGKTGRVVESDARSAP
jgi:transcriptional regulator with XRE-family HTH domain